jgi:hypothetical protein
MISRMWRGWTSQANADAYEVLLKTDIFPGFVKRNLSGYRGFEIHRRNLPAEVEFLTIMHFDSLDNIREFAGNQYEHAVMQQQDLRLLSRWDSEVSHYAVISDRNIAATARSVRFLRWLGIGLIAFGLLAFMTVADDLDHEAELAFAGLILLTGIASLLVSVKRGRHLKA